MYLVSRKKKLTVPNYKDIIDWILTIFHTSVDMHFPKSRTKVQLNILCQTCIMNLTRCGSQMCLCNQAGHLYNEMCKNKREVYYVLIKAMLRNVWYVFFFCDMAHTRPLEVGVYLLFKRFKIHSIVLKLQPTFFLDTLYMNNFGSLSIPTIHLSGWCHCNYHYVKGTKWTLNSSRLQVRGFIVRDTEKEA